MSSCAYACWAVGRRPVGGLAAIQSTQGDDAALRPATPHRRRHRIVSVTPCWVELAGEVVACHIGCDASDACRSSCPRRTPARAEWTTTLPGIESRGAARAACMTMQDTPTFEPTVPHWEWRTFGSDFGAATTAASSRGRLGKATSSTCCLGLPTSASRSAPNWSRSKSSWPFNADGLEQWRLTVRAGFPLPLEAAERAVRRSGHRCPTGRAQCPLARRVPGSARLDEPCRTCGRRPQAPATLRVQRVPCRDHGSSRGWRGRPHAVRRRNGRCPRHRHLGHDGASRSCEHL